MGVAKVEVYNVPAVNPEELARAMAVYIRKRLIGLLDDLSEALPKGYLTIAAFDHALQEAREMNRVMFTGNPHYEEACALVERAYRNFPQED